MAFAAAAYLLLMYSTDVVENLTRNFVVPRATYAGIASWTKVVVTQQQRVEDVM